jgi:hypothetical protein
VSGGDGVVNDHPAKRQRERRREYRRHIEVLREAAARPDGQIFGSDRQVRRLVRNGWAENPSYALGAARSATADITKAGRKEVGE